MINEAIEYAARGWHVFPVHGINADGNCTCGKIVCPDAGKHPLTKNGLKNASADEVVVREMFTPLGCFNIGVRTGKVSGITVIDIDVGHGKHGAETWGELIAEHGEPNTLMSQTGSGGMHVLFRYNAALKTGTNRLGAGIDVRNDGGYIVVPPSRHRSGASYEWLNDAPLDDLPEHLMAKKKAKRERNDPSKRKYSIPEVGKMLDHVDPFDRDNWRNVGVILGREFKRSQEAWDMYVAWAAKGEGKKGRNHDEIMLESFNEISQDTHAGKELTMGTIVYLAIAGGWVPKNGLVPISNFIYFAPGNNFVYESVSAHWMKEAVDCAVGMVNDDGQLVRASDWLKANRLATSMTKSPALTGSFIKGFNCREGELIEEVGAAVYNTYRKSTIKLGDSALASPFVEHVHRVFDKEGDADQFLDYMAHRVQRPEEKPRFALLIAGDQGVGKDTAVEFCIPSIGAWNVTNVEPTIFDSSFNEHASATLVRISEAASPQDMSKWVFNEKTKVLIAGSPDVVTINPKYGLKYSVKMHCGVIITTNHLLNGIYIPADDRRYDVIESASKASMGLETDEKVREYFISLWDWFNNDHGANHVAAFLHSRDLSKFSASNGQRKTAAHREVVVAGLGSDEWLDDAIEKLKRPDVIRVDWIFQICIEVGMKESEIRGRLPSAMGRAGYLKAINTAKKDGRWPVNGKYYAVYIKKGVALTAVMAAIEVEIF